MVARSGPRFLRPIRDQRLLDALDALELGPYRGTVWRSVREGRDPLACWRPGGRWDDGTVDVLYTSETRQAAIDERRFHLYQGQPIIPSRVRYELFELRVSLEAVMRLRLSAIWRLCGSILRATEGFRIWNDRRSIHVRRKLRKPAPFWAPTAYWCPVPAVWARTT